MKTQHGSILKQDLEIGAAYEVIAMWFDIAIWQGQFFIGVTPESENSIRVEKYWADNGTVKPLRKLK